MASVELDNVSKPFADGTRAFDGLDLDIADGEFMVLVGPSTWRTRAAAGDEIEVAIDHGALQFFDPRTGVAIR